MSNDAARLALFNGQNRQATARPAAHPETGTREEAGQTRIAQFKKSHALNGALLLWLLYVSTTVSTEKIK
jgi:hypothetical protein